MTTRSQENGGEDLLRVARRAGVWALVFLLVLLPLLILLYAYRVFLLTFGGMLLAIAVSSAAALLNRYTHLPRIWALLVVILLLAFVAGTAMWLVAPRVSQQIDELTTRIPESVHQLQGWAAQYGWGQRLISTLSGQYHTMLERGTLLSKTTTSFYWVAWSVTGIVMIAFVGLYFASDPDLYRRGALRCVPADNRKRAAELLRAVGHVLRRWLMGKSISMSIVGVLTGVGLWALGIPLALTLAIIAAILAFIPNFGPVISAVPAILLGLLQGPAMALYVALLYVGIQFVESYLITPMVQRWAVSLPPVLLIVFQVLMGVLAGTLGLVFATPLLAVLLVLVEMLYLEDLLGEHVALPGESTSTRREPSR